MESVKASMISRKTDELAARETAHKIMFLLNAFIPEACHKDALYHLAETFYKEGYELTSRQMRKEYEAWKSTQLDFLNMHPAPPND